MEEVGLTRLTVTFGVFSLLGVLGLAGCNQADPDFPMDTDANTSSEEDTSGGTMSSAEDDDTDDGEDDDSSGDDTSGDDTSVTEPGEINYFPMSDGATWTYRHTTSEQTVWDEIVNMTEITWNGMTAFESKDNPGGNGESTAAILIRDGTAIHRVHKDVDLAGAPVLAADYSPGFLRFDHSWQEGESIVWTYERTEYDAMGILVDQSPRNHIFTIESMSTSVTVPAGTFDCVQFTRERLETGSIKRFWFADGVGKVKHETLGSGATEELVEYSIP